MSLANPASTVELRPHEGTNLDGHDLIEMYRLMRLTRSVEDRVRRLYLQGALQGAVYSSRGQEGTAVASAYALSRDDYVAPLIRDLGASFTRGIEPWRVFAQWLGRCGGPTEGRDGNLHFGDLAYGILAPISMLGATIPLCAGVALAAVQRGEPRVALAYIGDGGTNTGDFHEGMNFAAVLRLPVIVIVENNGFAYSTPVESHVALESLADRAAAYGMPSITVDGNDVIAVYAETREAARRARAGGGPTLIEARTFRMRGHAEHDDASYVPSHLFDTWGLLDPIDRLAQYLESNDFLTQDERVLFDATIVEEVELALQRAEEQPFPDPATQQQGVYAPDLRV